MLSLSQPIEGIVYEFRNCFGLVFVVVLDLVDGMGSGLLLGADRANPVSEGGAFLEQVDSN